MSAIRQILALVICLFLVAPAYANDVDRELRRLQQRAPSGVSCDSGERLDSRSGRCVPMATVCSGRRVFDPYTEQCERAGRRSPNAYVGPSAPLNVPLSRKYERSFGAPVAPIPLPPLQKSQPRAR